MESMIQLYKPMLQYTMQNEHNQTSSDVEVVQKKKKNQYILLKIMFDISILMFIKTSSAMWIKSNRVRFLPSVAIVADGYGRRSLSPVTRPSICPSVCLYVPTDVTALTLRISGISLKLSGMMRSTLFKMVAL